MVTACPFTVAPLTSVFPDTVPLFPFVTACAVDTTESMWTTPAIVMSPTVAVASDVAWSPATAVDA